MKDDIPIGMPMTQKSVFQNESPFPAKMRTQTTARMHKTTIPGKTECFWMGRFAGINNQFSKFTISSKLQTWSEI
jgi:hypothetical protein